MSKAFISSLQALVAMADIELAQSALAMADAIDERLEAGRQVSRCESQQSELRATFERLAAPGQSIDISAMGFLARQSHLAEGQLELASSLQSEAQALVEYKQTALHQHQARHERLSDGLMEACLQRARCLEARAMLEIEDLFLMRRPSLEEQS
jgi:hypothetical protein